MSEIRMDLHQALDEVSASSAGGAPFLIAYGATFILTGILFYVLPIETVAIVAMFQGGAALPIAFWLERRMGSVRMAPDNPLRSLSVQLAMSQALGLPALILAYNLNPASIPVFLAGFGGVHFVPYAWLHRTRLYLLLGAAVALGAFALILVIDGGTFPIVMIYVGAVYWIMAPFVYRRAKGQASPATL